jgi:hypothetical protein
MLEKYFLKMGDLLSCDLSAKIMLRDTIGTSARIDPNYNPDDRACGLRCCYRNRIWYHVRQG